MAAIKIIKLHQISLIVQEALIFLYFIIRGDSIQETLAAMSLALTMILRISFSYLEHQCIGKHQSKKKQEEKLDAEQEGSAQMSWNLQGDHKLEDQHQISNAPHAQIWRKRLLQICVRSPQIISKICIFSAVVFVQSNNIFTLFLFYYFNEKNAISNINIGSLSIAQETTINLAMKFFPAAFVIYQYESMQTQDSHRNLHNLDIIWILIILTCFFVSDQFSFFFPKEIPILEKKQSNQQKQQLRQSQQLFQQQQEHTISNKKLLSHISTTSHFDKITSKKAFEIPKTTEAHLSTQSIPSKTIQPSNKDTMDDTFVPVFLQDLVQLLPQGIALVNASKEILYNNSQILDLLSCDKHDVLKTITQLSTKLNAKSAGMQQVQNSPYTQFYTSQYPVAKPNTFTNLSQMQQHQALTNKQKMNNTFAAKRMESSFDNILNSPYIGEENSSPRQLHNSSFHKRGGYQHSLFSSGPIHSPPMRATKKSGSSADSKQKQNLQDFLLETLGNEELRIKATLSPHKQKHHLQENIATRLAVESGNDTEDEKYKREEKQHQQQQQQTLFGSTKHTQKQDVHNDSFAKQLHIMERSDKAQFLSFSVDLSKQQDAAEPKIKLNEDDQFDPHKSTTNQYHQTQKDSFDQSQSMIHAGKFHRSFSNLSLSRKKQYQQKQTDSKEEGGGSNQSFSREPSQIELYKPDEINPETDGDDNDDYDTPADHTKKSIQGKHSNYYTNSRHTRKSQAQSSQKDSTLHLNKKELNQQMSIIQPQIKQMNVKVGHLLSSMLEDKAEAQNNNNLNSNNGGIKKSNSKNVAFSQISEVFESSYSKNQSLFGQINGNYSIGFYQCKDNVAQIQVQCKGKSLEVLLIPCENPSEPEQSLVLIIVQPLWEDLIKARLEESNQRRLKLFGSLCHELRTPLNCAISFLDLYRQIKEGEDDQALIDEYVVPSLKSNQFMLNTVNDILDFVQMSENKFKFSPMKFDFPKLLEECQSLMSIQAKTKAIDLTLELAPNIPVSITSDPNRIRQIILNFLSNAMKFTPKGGFIAIEAHLVEQQSYDSASPNGIIKVSVKDSGIGIAKTALRRIFEIFNKTSYDDESINPNGCGIGLPLSNSLAKLVGPQTSSPDTQNSKSIVGGIHVESEQDKGSIFSFCIQDLTLQKTIENQESCEIRTENYQQQQQQRQQSKRQEHKDGKAADDKRIREGQNYRIDVNNLAYSKVKDEKEEEPKNKREEVSKRAADLKAKVLEYENGKRAQDQQRSQTNICLVTLNNSNLNTLISSSNINNNEGVASNENNSNQNNQIFTFNNTSLISNGTSNMLKMDVIEDQAGGLSLYHFEPAQQFQGENNRIKISSTNQISVKSHSLIKQTDTIKIHTLDPYGIENLFPIKSQQNVTNFQNPLNMSPGSSVNKAKSSLNNNEGVLSSKIMKNKSYEMNLKGEPTKILIVDDSPFNLLVLKKVIELFHIKNTEQCHDGGEVVDKISSMIQEQERPFDLIFMDIDLPVLNGFEACKEIKQMLAQEEEISIPIVACSAFGSQIKDDHAFYISQLDDAISKPIKQDELEGIFEKYLRNAENN